MLSLARERFWIAALLCLTAMTQANSSTQDTRLTGTISGRLTINGKPASHISVVLEPFDSDTEIVSTARAVTDVEGHYRLMDVPEGRYQISPAATSLILVDGPGFGRSWMKSYSSLGPLGLIVTVARGEIITGVDFALAPGGVITGRVIDAEGRPVIEAGVSCSRINERGDLGTSPSRNQTDDRGVYRIYGLPAGDYLVSVTVNRIGNKHYQPTFHPDVIEHSHATPVKVAAGGESTSVDVRLGQPEKTHLISGRVIDAATGGPVSGVPISCFSSLGRQSYISSDSQGEFKIEACPRGRYTLEVASTGQPNKGYYSDRTVSEVVAGDVSGVEVKVHHGASISGMAVIEGTNDPAILERLSDLMLSADWSAVKDGVTNSPGPTRNSVVTATGPGGRFEFTGLRPTRMKISPVNLPEGFSLLRVERNGVSIKDGIDLSPGETIPGETIRDVRVVIAYGTGSIRGKAKIVGGTLPEKMMWRITARRADGEEVFLNLVDASGRFWIKGLAPGEYELEAEADYVEIPGVTPSPYPPPVRQKVIVVNGDEAEVSLILDLGNKRNQ